MKLLLTAIAISGSLLLSAQTPYKEKVTFNLPDVVDEAGATLKRKGQLQGIIYDPPADMLIIRVYIKYFSNQTELGKYIKPEVKDFSIDNETFLVSATGVKVGDRKAMRQLYGVRDPADSTKWLKSVLGGDSLTTSCIGEYDHTLKAFEVNNKFHNIIKALIQSAAVDGKLD